MQSFTITATYAYSQSAYYAYSQAPYYAYSQSAYYVYSQAAYVTPTSTPSPIALVQSAGAANSSAASISKAFGSSNAAGNLLIVSAGRWCNAAPGTLTISDTLGNIYSLVTNTTSVGSPTSQSTASVWYAPNSKAGTNTVTVSSNGSCSSASLEIAIHEYSGLAASSPLDTNNKTTAIAVSSLNTGNVMTASPSELLFSFGYDQTNANDSWTVSSGWTKRVSVSNPGNDSLQTADEVVSAAGTYSNTFGISPNMSYGLHAQIATFKGNSSYTGGNVIPTTLFGMHQQHMSDPYPPNPLGAAVGAIGKGSLVAWPYVQQSCPSHVSGHDDCPYDWSTNDAYVTFANSHGLDIFFSNDYVPIWAGTSGCTTNTLSGGGTACLSNVVNIQDWDNFVNTMVTRYDGQHGHGRIRNYECWN